MRCLPAACAIAITITAVIMRADEAKPKTDAAAVTVVLADGKSVALSAVDLAALPAAKVKWKGGAELAGVAVAEILKRAGAVLGGEHKGPHLTTYVLIEGADGYRVLFSLSELDPGFTNNVVLLAVRRDGKPLPEAEGPYRLIAPGDKRPARSVKQVVKIAVCVVAAQK